MEVDLRSPGLHLGLSSAAPATNCNADASNQGLTWSMEEARLTNLLGEALREIPAPERGLPDAAFSFALKIVPMVNVDLLVKAKDGRTLLAWREDEYGTGWHIPGGIIRLGEMTQDRIHAVADHELAAQVSAEA